MRLLERLTALSTIIVLGAALGFALASMRDRQRIREAEAARDGAIADRDNVLRFVGLVVDKVEADVGRTAKLLESCSEFARPGAPTYPPTAFAGGFWWSYDPLTNRWTHDTEIEP